MNAILQKFKQESPRGREALNISEDVFMYQLSIIKSARKYHDKSNVVCEELKSKLKVTDQPVVDIG